MDSAAWASVNAVFNAKAVESIEQDMLQVLDDDTSLALVQLISNQDRLLVLYPEVYSEWLGIHRPVNTVSARSPSAQPSWSKSIPRSVSVSGQRVPPAATASAPAAVRLRRSRKSVAKAYGADDRRRSLRLSSKPVQSYK